MKEVLNEAINEMSTQVSEAERLRYLVKSEGWALVENKLKQLIINLSDITKITEEDPNKLAITLAVNKKVISILMEWLADIKGDINKQSYSGILNEMRNDIVLNLEN